MFAAEGEPNWEGVGGSGGGAAGGGAEVPLTPLNPLSKEPLDCVRE